MDPDLKQLKTLDTKQLYHFQLSASSSSEAVQSFARAVSELGLRGLITKEGTVVETLVELFGKLPQDKKDEIFAILSDRPKFTIDESPSKRKLVLAWDDRHAKSNESGINPLDHEQTK